MSDLPPPSAPPPPGWYPDPTTGGRGFRWWDGSTWTDQWTEQPEQPEVEREPGLAPVSEWISELLAVVTSRAGHFFTLIVVLMVPITLVNGTVSFYTFRNLVVTIDREAGTTGARNPDVPPGLYVAFGVSYLLILVLSVAVVLAATRQAQAGIDERSEPWSVSARAAITRLPRTVLYLIVVGVALFAVYLVLLITVAFVPLLVVLVLPAWIVGSLWILARFALVPACSVLAPAPANPLRISTTLTSGRVAGIVGRLALLSLFSITVWLTSRFIAAPFVALAGGGDAAPIDPSADEYRVGDLLGDNPATFAIGQLFGALGNGASLVLWAVGLTLLYRDLAGPRAEDLTDESTAITTDGY